MGNPSELPGLAALGRELLVVSGWRVSLSLTTPFLLAGAFFILAGTAASGWSIIPLAYALFVYLGTWVTPLATSFLPHSPKGSRTLTQTRRIRGWVARLLTLDHLYHLEHHLFPAVPHHRWRELACRLDPFLDRAGVPILRLGR